MTTTIDTTQQMDLVTEGKTHLLIDFLESLHLRIQGDDNIILRNLNDDSRILIETSQELEEYIERFRNI